VTTPKADIRRMADAVLPLHVTANDEGFISVIDTDGYFVLSLTPTQLAAIVRAVETVRWLPVGEGKTEAEALVVALEGAP